MKADQARARKDAFEKFKALYPYPSLEEDRAFCNGHAAGWNAALDAAAEKARHEIWHGVEDCDRLGEHVAAAILALKGERS